MTQQTPTVTLERYTGATWLDISPYLSARGIEIDVGLRSDKYDDRLAKVGTFRFYIKNSDGHFTPSADFKKNSLLRLTIKWYGQTKIFMMYVDYIEPPKGTYGAAANFIVIHATDWFGMAYKHLIKAVVVDTDQRVDEAATTLLADMPINPTATDFATGIETFPLMFDTIRMGKSTIYSELNKLALSELGYIYLTNNDTLTIENFNRRNQYIAIGSQSYTIPAAGTAILAEDGTSILAEDGTEILADEYSAETYSNNLTRFEDVEVVHGENIINDVAFTVRPRNVGDDIEEISTFNIYTLTDAPYIYIADGETVKLRGTYWKEIGYPTTTKTKIDAAMSVDEPAESAVFVSGSEFNQVPDSTTNMTYNFTGAADAWEWEIINNSGGTKYIQRYSFYGVTISNGQPLEHSAEDTDSQTLYGHNSVRVDQAYQQSLDRAKLEVAKLLDEEAEPRTQLKSITTTANANANEMAAFMLTDIGDLRNVVLSNPAINSNFFVQGINATISAGGIIKWTPRLKEKYTNSPLVEMGLRYSGVASSKNMVTFPRVAAIEDLAQKSISFWVYMISGMSTVITSNYDTTGGGHEVWILTDHIQFNHAWSGSLGIWTAGSLLGVYGQWVHIVVTYDRGSTANDPVIYVNDVSQVVTETFAPTGTHLTDTHNPLRIGNRRTTADNAIYDPSMVIKDVRYYDTILTAGNVTTIYSNPNNYDALITGSTVFQAPFVRTDLEADYIDDPITPTMPLVDRIGLTNGKASYAAVTNGELKGADPSLSSY
jgi:hypothetical protein